MSNPEVRFRCSTPFYGSPTNKLDSLSDHSPSPRQMMQAMMQGMQSGDMMSAMMSNPQVSRTER